MVFILSTRSGYAYSCRGRFSPPWGPPIFGPYFGFFYVWLGAMMDQAGFLDRRHLGREFACIAIGDRLRKYDEGIERNGFATVLYLRLVYFRSLR